MVTEARAARLSDMTSRTRARLIAIALVCLAGCGAAAPTAVVLTGSGSRSYSVDTGTDFTIRLQTIGPGAYESPPGVSSSIVRFLDVSQAAFAIPAGPTQLFRFHAASSGQAIIVFSHSGNNPVVTDTIAVR
jgi:hypothetical protein